MTIKQMGIFTALILQLSLALTAQASEHPDCALLDDTVALSSAVLEGRELELSSCAPRPAGQNSISDDGTITLSSTSSDSPTFTIPNTVWQTDIESKVAMLGQDFAGESIDVASGNLSFRHVDVSLPGNSHLPVAFARRYSIDGIDYSGNILGGWIPDVPFLTLRRGGGGTVFDGENRGGSCLTGVVVRLSASPYTGAADPIRNNIRMYIPGQGSQPLIKPNTGTVNHPYYATTGDTTGTTTGHWKVVCQGDMANVPGTAIVATAPNGDKYYFDTLVKRYAGPELEPLLRCSSRVDCEEDGLRVLQAFHYNIYASKVVDVNGHQVNWHYDNNGYLTQISGSDGRSITIGYTDFPFTTPPTYTLPQLFAQYDEDTRRITSVTANGRTWTYGYAGENDDNYYPVPQMNLRTVTRPDGKQWLLNLPMQNNRTTEYFNSYRCWAADRAKDDIANQKPVVYSGSFLRYLPTQNYIIHPEGTRIDYEFSLIKNAGGILNQWDSPAGQEGTDLWNTGKVGQQNKRLCESQYHNMTIAKAVNRKTVTRSDNISRTWRYEYQESNFCPAISVASQSTKKRTVFEPDGTKTDHHFYCGGPKNGRIARTELRSPGNTLLETATFDYATETWTRPLGPTTNKFEQHQANVSQQVITRGTDTFTRDFTFNTDVTKTDYSYSRPVKLAESNNVTGYSRTFDYSYTQYRDSWILQNLLEIKQDGVSTSRVTLDTLGHPTHHYQFNTLVGRYAYKTDAAEKGLLHTYTDALNRVRTFSNYKRGLAQTLTRPDGKTQQRVVDNNGRITKVTDANSQCTRYTWNNIGRLTLIDPCDAAWSNTSISYGVADGSEHSHYVYPGMFKQTVTRGHHQSIHFLDSLLRPVLTQEWDNRNAGTKRFTRFEYDYANRVTFASKPFSGGTTSSGTVTSYDALDRITQVNDNTLTGTVNYYFENGHQIRVNDNRGNNTTTRYLAFGFPQYEQPLNIASPENVNTGFVYNAFGNVTATTQSGRNAANQTISLTERRAYDSLQQLCKVTRPDVGQTVYHHNSAGQLLWLAEGTGGGTVTDCVSNASAADKVMHTYDLLDNVKTITYPGTGGFTRTFTYDNNNNMTRIVSGGVTQDYTWNSLNLLTSENLQLDGKTFPLGYGYDALGHISTVTYPDGDVVSFAPNALGQPQQAVRQRAGHSAYTYASGASYYPNGSINTFTYGNDLTHKTTLNSAQLPAQVKDSRSGLTALDYAYQYDGNLNVTRLTDNVNGSYNLTSLTYDGLDRLTNTAGGAGIGSSTLTYDGLGNITRYQSKGRNLTYSYNYSQNRLTGVNDSIGTKDYAFFSYDDRGNITNTSFNGLTFNRANQVTAATTTTGSSNSYLYDGHDRRVKKTSSNGTEYSFYGQDGTLLYRETPDGGINYLYLGNKLIAKDGFIPEDSGKQHYRPYGESIEGATDDVGYTGHKFDKDLGLSYMQARYYDPVIGRFYSNDPVDALGHIGRGNSIAHGFNRYAYANNNPYKYVDPDGKLPLALALIPELVVIGEAALVTAGVIGTAAAVDSAFDQIGQMNESATPDLPTDLVGDQSDPRAGSNKSGNRHTSGPLTADNGGTGDFETDLETLAGETRPAEPGDSAPPGSLVGENGVFGRPENSSGGASIDIPANGDKPHETLHYEKK